MVCGRSNPTTSLNCWREVSEFRSAVSQVEKVNFWAFLSTDTCVDIVFQRTTLPHYVDQNILHRAIISYFETLPYSLQLLICAQFFPWPYGPIRSLQESYGNTIMEPGVKAANLTLRSITATSTKSSQRHHSLNLSCVTPSRIHWPRSSFHGASIQSKQYIATVQYLDQQYKVKS